MSTGALLRLGTRGSRLALAQSRWVADEVQRRHPDLTVELQEEPQDLALVRVGDLDGDGRADLSITRPLPVPEEGVSSPVRLDLYLSGGAR